MYHVSENIDAPRVATHFSYIRVSLSHYALLPPFPCPPLPRSTQTNELRKINTVMTTDLAQAASSEGQVRIRGAAAVREAETTLRDHPIGTAAAVAGGARSFRHAAGAVVGAIRFSTRQLAGAGGGPRAGPAQQQDTVALRKAKEMGQWVVQNPPEEHQVGVSICLLLFI